MMASCSKACLPFTIKLYSEEKGYKAIEKLQEGGQCKKIRHFVKIWYCAHWLVDKHIRLSRTTVNPLKSYRLFEANAVISYPVMLVGKLLIRTSFAAPPGRLFLTIGAGKDPLSCKITERKSLNFVPRYMKVKIINHSRHALPAYETIASAGMDLKANLDTAVLLHPGERAMIPTALFMELPAGYEAQVRPRSGLAWKHGITVLNSPGTIDADYRGEIKIILVNHGQESFEIRDGERIAQLVIAKHERVTWVETGDLQSSERGAGGFGSTGK